MAGSTFGTIFKVMTWGESHGKGIGVVIDGCPAGIPLSEEDIQPFLNRRKPGQNRYTTKRAESDLVEILREHLREKQREHRFLCWFGIRISVHGITARSHSCIARDMRITPMMRNMDFGITAAADAHPGVRRSQGWQRAQWQKSFWRSLGSRLPRM